MSEPTNYQYKPGFGLEDLANAAYDPIAEITPIVGDKRAADRGWQNLKQASQEFQQGNYLNAGAYGLGALGEYATAAPVLGTGMDIAKVAGHGLSMMAGKSVPMIGGLVFGRQTFPKEITKEIYKNISSQSRETKLKEFNESGWFKDVIGDVKKEISDLHADVSDQFYYQVNSWNDNDILQSLNKMEDVGQQTEFKLKDVLKHDSLYGIDEKTGINFGDINVVVNPDLERSTAALSWKTENVEEAVRKGFIDPNQLEIQVNPNKFRTKLQLTSSVLHELQHAIQFFEEFSIGTGPEHYTKFLDSDSKEILTRQVKNLKDRIKNNPYDVNLKRKLKGYEEQLNFTGDAQWNKMFKSGIFKKLGTEGYNDPEYELYIHTLGELESTMVEERYIQSTYKGKKAYQSLPPTTYGTLVKPYISQKWYPNIQTMSYKYDLNP